MYLDTIQETQETARKRARTHILYYRLAQVVPNVCQIVGGKVDGWWAGLDKGPNKFRVIIGKLGEHAQACVIPQIVLALRGFLLRL